MTIKLQHRKRDGIYIADFYQEGSRKRKSLGTTDKAEARRLLSALEYAVLNEGLNPFDDAELSAHIRRLKFGEPAAALSTLRVSDAIEQFKEEKVNWKPKTREGYSQVLKQFNDSLPGGLTMAGLTHRHISKFLGSYDNSPSTKHSYYRHIRAFLKWAIRKELLPDILKHFDAPKNGKAIPDFLSHANYQSLLTTVENAGQDWLADIIRVTCYTGLRRSEVTRLEVRDVDFQTGMIKVRNVGAETTKSGHERSVPIVGDAVEVLERLCTDRPGREKVFVGWNGKPITDAEKMSKIFKSYAERAGLDRAIKFHSMRDTCASWMVMRGVPLRVVQQVLGHSSITVTEKYAHLSGAFYKDAVVKAFTSESPKQETGASSDEIAELKKQNEQLQHLMRNLMGLVQDSQGYSLDEIREILNQDRQINEGDR